MEFHADVTVETSTFEILYAQQMAQTGYYLEIGCGESDRLPLMFRECTSWSHVSASMSF